MNTPSLSFFASNTFSTAYVDIRKGCNINNVNTYYHWCNWYCGSSGDYY